MKTDITFTANGPVTLQPKDLVILNHQTYVVTTVDGCNYRLSVAPWHRKLFNFLFTRWHRLVDWLYASTDPYQRANKTNS